MRTPRQLARELADAPASTRAYAGLCLASAGWASAFLFGKVVLAEVSALPAAAWRHTLAALVLLPFAWRLRRLANLRAAWLPLVVMMVCGGVLYPWSFLAALERTSATNTSLLIALNPALTFLLSPLVGESYSRRGLLGIALALSGAALVITHGDLALLASLTSARSGDLIAVGAAMIWAIFNIAARGVVAHLPHSVTNTLVYSVGSLGLFALAGPGDAVADIATASSAALAALLGMVVVGSVASGQLFLNGVQIVGVSRSVVFVYVVPVLTAVASSILLDEALVPAQIVGGAAVLAGVYVTTRAPARPPETVERSYARRAPLDEHAA